MNLAENITDNQVFSAGECIRILAPNDSRQSLESFFKATRDLQPGLQPFCFELREVVTALAGEILKSPALKSDTGAVALAFWLRHANIERIRDSFFSPHLSNELLFVVPVGKVFHLAPSNVDTLFVYSWALSFLCGNANIVRLSSSVSPVCEGLLECIGAVMDRHPMFRQHNLFMTCPHGSEAIVQCSAWCSHRIIWGGDATIGQIRPIPLPSHASERVFGTKYSFAVFCADRILGDSDGQIELVSRALFNDIFQFNQRACSSPHVIFWIGTPADSGRAIAKLEHALLTVIQERKLEPSISAVVQRFSQACLLSSETSSKIHWHNGLFTSIEQDHIKSGDEKGLCGGGFLRHVSINAVDQLGSYVSPNDQTVSYYGLSDDQLQIIARTCGPRGVDRIVPAGQALDFSPVWDGFDLIGDFIRRVQVVR